MSTRLLDVRSDGAITMRGARLVVQRGPDRGRALRIGKEEIAIGTADGADLVLTDKTVSRNHLLLRAQPLGFLAIDLESTNGTFLDGHRIKQAYLTPGDVIELGKTRLKLEAVREPVDLQLSPHERFGRMLGRAPVTKRLFALLEAVAQQDVTVALAGETGTGKDVAAESIHELSARQDGPFVVVDCSAIPSSLLESELFGHEKGAFTGATQARTGAFAAAAGGTLFLDEIGELPRDLQPKLLRAVERREVKPVGAARPLPVDLRIISATNRDLRVDVNKGLFREDLYYRLNVVAIRLPPLRERPEDIALLAEHFRRELTGDADGALPDALLADFQQYHWPGNVRELRNRVECAVLVPLLAESIAPRAADEELSFRDAKQRAMDAFEQRYLASLLQLSDGNVSQAARRAKMDRVHLSKLLGKHGIRR
jgi:transcriptional regulator with GAF, ATPase, and Fis domain